MKKVKVEIVQERSPPRPDAKRSSSSSSSSSSDEKQPLVRNEKRTQRRVRIVEPSPDPADRDPATLSSTAAGPTMTTMEDITIAAPVAHKLPPSPSRRRSMLRSKSFTGTGILAGDGDEGADAHGASAAAPPPAAKPTHSILKQSAGAVQLPTHLAKRSAMGAATASSSAKYTTTKTPPTTPPMAPKKSPNVKPTVGGGPSTPPTLLLPPPARTPPPPFLLQNPIVRSFTAPIPVRSASRGGVLSEDTTTAFFARVITPAPMFHNTSMVYDDVDIPPTDQSDEVKPLTAEINTSASLRLNKPEPSDSDGHVHKEIKLIHLFLFLEMTLLSLSVSFIEVMIIPALNVIEQNYPDQKEWVPWVVSIYLITGGLSTPIFSAMSGRMGLQLPMAICLGVYCFGIIGCGLSFLSPNIAVLITMRGIQGIGMGIFTLCFTLIKASFPVKFMTPTLGFVSALFSIGSSIGLLGGGAALAGIHFTYNGEDVSWACLFWIVGPIVVIGGLCFMITSAKDPATPAKKKGKKIDVLGCIFLSISISTFLLGITLGEEGWVKPAPLTLLCICPFALAGYVLWELHYKNDALFPPQIMKNRTVCILNIAAFSTGYAMFALSSTAPFFLSDPDGPFGYTSTLQIGLILFPSSLPGLIVAPINAILARKIGAANVITMSLGFSAIAFVLATLYHSTVFEVVFLQTLGGAAMCGSVSMVMVIMAGSVPLEFFASAAAVNTLFRIVGGSMGPIVSGVFVDTSGSSTNSTSTSMSSGLLSSIISISKSISGSSSTAPEEWAAEKGYMIAWGLAAVILSVAFLASLALPGQLQTCESCREKIRARKYDKLSENYVSESTGSIELGGGEDDDTSVDSNAADTEYNTTFNSGDGGGTAADTTEYYDEAAGDGDGDGSGSGSGGYQEEQPSEQQPLTNQNQ
ncbi:bicyclomycin/multidrug efflux system [Pelomyxa schiedti]|nr:bicyclomycin/multidrug efflux system [Pelomyxa schiedti]